MSWAGPLRRVIEPCMVLCSDWATTAAVFVYLGNGYTLTVRIDDAVPHALLSRFVPWVGGDAGWFAIPIGRDGEA